MQKSCPDSALTKITDPLLEPEMPNHRVPEPRPKRCGTNTLLSMLSISGPFPIEEEWVCLFFFFFQLKGAKLISNSGYLYGQLLTLVKNIPGKNDSNNNHGNNNNATMPF